MKKMPLKFMALSAALVIAPAVASADTNPDNLPIISHETVVYPAAPATRFDGYPFISDGNGLPEGIPHNGWEQPIVVYAWESDDNGLPKGVTQPALTPTVVYPWENDANGLPEGT